MTFGDDRLPPRFWKKVDVNECGCWIWIAALSSGGYGTIGGGPRDARWQAKAHRHAYETLVGPVPDGLELDHLCRVRACVNPAHLEPVTRAENIRRSPIGIALVRKTSAHCKHGHEFTPENTGRPTNGQRACRECNRLRCAAFYQARKAAQSCPQP